MATTPRSHVVSLFNQSAFEDRRVILTPGLVHCFAVFGASGRFEGFYPARLIGSEKYDARTAALRLLATSTTAHELYILYVIMAQLEIGKKIQSHFPSGDYVWAKSSRNLATAKEVLVARATVGHIYDCIGHRIESCLWSYLL